MFPKNHPGPGVRLSLFGKYGVNLGNAMEIQGQVTLKKGREASARRFHPWIFSGAIQSVEGDPPNGAWVGVKDASGNVLGHGHFQKGTITVRLLSFSANPPMADFYGDRIGEAWLQRTNTGVAGQSTNCYRLVHGEGDGLSGLIIDWYHGVAVIQAHSAGMHNDRGIYGVHCCS